jgi:integrase
MDDMARKLPPFCYREKSRHGQTRYYFRRGKGTRHRLPDFADPTFWAAYEQARTNTVKQRREPPSGTFAWLVSRYRNSAQYQSAAPATRRMRDQILQRVEANVAGAAYADIKRRHIIRAMEDRSATPHAANNFLKIMSGLFKWAVYHDLIEINPCDGVQKIKAPTDGFHSWKVAEVRQFQEHWQVGTMPRLALDLMLYTGLRRGDVCKVGRQHVKDGVIVLRTGKNKADLSLTIYPALQRSIDATPARDLAFLTTEKGTPFASAASFGNWFAKKCQEAGVPDQCRAHGLRKAGATIAAQNGATTRQLMSMYGWRTSAMADLYTRSVDQQAMAAEAGERIENSFAPHRDPERPAPSGNITKINYLKK